MGAATADSRCVQAPIVSIKDDAPRSGKRSQSICVSHLLFVGYEDGTSQHAPTVYFWPPLPEWFLIEPTETKEAMDDFVDAMEKATKSSR